MLTDTYGGVGVWVFKMITKLMARPETPVTGTFKRRKNINVCALYQSAYGFLGCGWLGETHISILLKDAYGDSGWMGIKIIIAYGCLRKT